MSAPNMERFCRLAVNGLIVNPNICDEGAVETVGVRSSPQPTCYEIGWLAGLFRRKLGGVGYECSDYGKVL